MQAFPISHRFLPMEIERAWKVGLQKDCISRVSCRALNRRVFLDSMGIGAALVITEPAFSKSFPEPKRSESVSDIRKLDSGVKIQEIIAGEGAEAQSGSRVQFNCVCRRSNGYFVFSTVDQFTGESNPVTLLLDGDEIIEGLKEVLLGMRVGGKRRALIPPNAGYVNESRKPIPEEFGPRRSLLSHATEPLVFEVQLLKVL